MNFRLWFYNAFGDTYCEECGSLYEAKRKMPDFIDRCVSEYDQRDADYSIDDVNYGLVIKPVFNEAKEISGWEIKQ